MFRGLLGIPIFPFFLYGRKFTLRTDHAGLTYLHKFSDNNSRLVRWSQQLAEFQFKIEYRPGTSISHVYLLSRPVRIVTTEEPVTKDMIRQEQIRQCATLNTQKFDKGTEFFLY
jgi:hypothetical protein